MWGGGGVANAAPTAWNWGGYVPTADTPVIGGFASTGGGSCYNVMGSNYCNYYYGVVAFGLVAYTSIPSGNWYGGSYTSGQTPGWITCPSNTAPIDVVAPYTRADGVVFNPYIYAMYGSSTYAGYPSKVTLCVKTDTY